MKKSLRTRQSPGQKFHTQKRRNAPTFSSFLAKNTAIQSAFCKSAANLARLTVTPWNSAGGPTSDPRVRSAHSESSGKRQSLLGSAGSKRLPGTRHAIGRSRKLRASKRSLKRSRARKPTLQCCLLLKTKVTRLKCSKRSMLAQRI